MLNLLPLNGWCQRQSAAFEDGTKIEYEVLTDRPEHMSRLGIFWGAFTTDLVEGLQIQFAIPGKGLVSLQTNVLGAALYGDAPDSLYTQNEPPAARSFRLRGVYFIKTNDKPKTLGLTLKSESTGYNEQTVYQLEYEVPRTYAWGVHGGIGYRNTDLLASSPYGLTYTELAMGVALTRSRNIALMTSTGKGKPRKYKGSSQMLLYADALLFFGIEAPHLENQIQMDLDNFQPSEAGFEMGWQGRTSFWGKRDWGFYAQAGFLVAPARSTPTFGFGIYAGFNNLIP
ncbi:MAG: hypothetical protein ACPGYK_02500 [Flavobacteriales bacterium]